MHPSKKLTRILRELLELIEEEAVRNPAFAQRLESIADALPLKKKENKRRSNRKQQLPDVIAVYQEKGDVEFRYWARSFDLETLREIVKVNGFDPGKATRHWSEPDKFVALLADQIAARLRRGSAFLEPSRTSTTRTDEKT